MKLNATCVTPSVLFDAAQIVLQNVRNIMFPSFLKCAFFFVGKRMSDVKLTKIFICAILYALIFCTLLKYKPSFEVLFSENSIKTVIDSDEKLLFQSCSSTHPTALNVHIVCHTHLDTGWVETYDEYYFRCK